MTSKLLHHIFNGTTRGNIFSSFIVSTIICCILLCIGPQTLTTHFQHIGIDFCPVDHISQQPRCSSNLIVYVCLFASMFTWFIHAFLLWFFQLYSTCYIARRQSHFRQHHQTGNDHILFTPSGAEQRHDTVIDNAIQANSTTSISHHETSNNSSNNNNNNNHNTTFSFSLPSISPDYTPIHTDVTVLTADGTTQSGHIVLPSSNLGAAGFDTLLNYFDILIYPMNFILGLWMGPITFEIKWWMSFNVVKYFSIASIFYVQYIFLFQRFMTRSDATSRYYLCTIILIASITCFFAALSGYSYFGQTCDNQIDFMYVTTFTFNLVGIIGALIDQTHGILPPLCIALYTQIVQYFAFAFNTHLFTCSSNPFHYHMTTTNATVVISTIFCVLLSFIPIVLILLNLTSRRLQPLSLRLASMLPARLLSTSSSSSSASSSATSSITSLAAAATAAVSTTLPSLSTTTPITMQPSLPISPSLFENLQPHATVQLWQLENIHDDSSLASSSSSSSLSPPSFDKSTSFSSRIQQSSLLELSIPYTLLQQYTPDDIHNQYLQSLAIHAMDQSTYASNFFYSQSLGSQHWPSTTTATVAHTSQHDVTGNNAPLLSSSMIYSDDAERQVDNVHDGSLSHRFSCCSTAITTYFIAVYAISAFVFVITHIDFAQTKEFTQLGLSSSYSDYFYIGQFICLYCVYMWHLFSRHLCPKHNLLGAEYN